MNMRSFTDVFIKHPVLAIVVNLVIVLAVWRALTTLPVQQYPKIESSSVVITTVYYGASAETVRWFLSTPVAVTTYAASAVAVAYAVRRAGASLDDKKVPLLGVTAAFVFAAQVPSARCTQAPGYRKYWVVTADCLITDPLSVPA